MTRLISTFVVFHLLVGAALPLLVAVWWHSIARFPGRRAGIVITVVTMTAFLTVSVGATFVIAVFRHSLNRFLLIRLLAQALFGELPVLLLTLAMLAWRTARRFLSGGLAVALLGVFAVYFEAYHREPTDLHVRRHRIDFRRGPNDNRVLRIVHVSDIQSDRVGAYEAGVLRAARALSPDLVALTGDYVHSRWGGRRDTAVADLHALFAREVLSAPLGVFAVPGDVDREWPEPFSGLGFHLLSDQTERVALPGGRSLAIVGLAPPTSHGANETGLRRLLRESADVEIRLVIGHSPDFVLQFEKEAIPTLALAGHTHGGQVALPFLGPPLTLTQLPRRYALGLHRLDGTWLHVSAGVGLERGAAPQIRFLVPPEICLIEIAH